MSGILGIQAKLYLESEALSARFRCHRCLDHLLVQLEASKFPNLSFQIIKMVSLEKGPSDFRPASVYERADYQILNSELEGW
jgi:hypothetical protein